MQEDEMKGFLTGVTFGLVVWALVNGYRHKRSLHYRLNKLNNRMNQFQDFMGTINHERKAAKAAKGEPTGTLRTGTEWSTNG